MAGTRGTLGALYTADLTRLLTYWRDAFHDVSREIVSLVGDETPAAARAD